MDNPNPSRRKFLAATAQLASATWIAMNWADIAAAAEQADAGGHAGHGGMAMPAAPVGIKTLSAADAADVEAVANQIVPGGGVNPGARDIHAINFIDNALGSFFEEQAPSFRNGLAEFQKAFAAKNGGLAFAKASDAQQIAFLREVDKTPFFLVVRRLTVLGIIAMPKYGGNFEGLGNKLIGVIDRHVWAPPFGYYDRDYKGFEPYPGTKITTA